MSVGWIAPCYAGAFLLLLAVFVYCYARGYAQDPPDDMDLR